MSLSMAAILQANARMSFDTSDPAADVDTYTAKKSAPKPPTPKGLMAAANTSKKLALQGGAAAPVSPAKEVADAIVAAIRGPATEQQD
tara:strand:+ start:404 stop:667 length:264 start_codon:yes stop_codon:yes gene_type:complete